MLTLLLCAALHSDSSITSGGRFKKKTLHVQSMVVLALGRLTAELWLYRVSVYVHKGVSEVILDTLAHVHRWCVAHEVVFLPLSPAYCPPRHDKVCFSQNGLHQLLGT